MTHLSDKATDKEVLEYAIKKAVVGGWQPFEFGNPTSVTQWHDNNMVEIAVVFPLHYSPVEWVRELEGIVFSHEFCKALFGDEIIPYPGLPRKYSMIAWQYHGTQLFLAEDRIDYLRKNLP